MIKISLTRPWLHARLCAPMRLFSHALHGGGFLQAADVFWREVKNADLPLDFAVERWFTAQMAEAQARVSAVQAVGMLTSRDIGCHSMADVRVGAARAQALVTLGLSNAEAVGQRLPYHPAEYGTVNILVACDQALSEVAQIEAFAIAVQARTAAIMDMQLPLATGIATGTGTDCLVMACPPGTLAYAGLHTETGEAIGAAVRQAVSAAGRDWLAWRSAALAAMHARSLQ